MELRRSIMELRPSLTELRHSSHGAEAISLAGAPQIQTHPWIARSGDRLGSASIWGVAVETTRERDPSVS